MADLLAAGAYRLQGVRFSYDRQVALDAVDLQIAKGEQIALLGANGSGKSTLLRILGALAFPQDGLVEFYGHSLTAASLALDTDFYSFRQRVGILFQNPDVQLFNASVLEEVAFGPLHMGWPKAEIRDRVEEALIRFGIESLRDRPPHRLSGGEKKRVALASVLVLDPEVLLLDEPTAALDPKSRETIVELIESWRSGPRTIVTATHDLDIVDRLSDRCYLLQNGTVVGAADSIAMLHDVTLLERAGLIRAHTHRHSTASATPHPHPHVHRQDIR